MKSILAFFLFFFLANDVAAQQSRFFFRKLTVADGLSNGAVISVGQDSKGFMWFITRSGLSRFDGYSFKTYSHIAGDTSSIPTQLGKSISVDSSGGLLVGLEDGMLEYNEKEDRFIQVKGLEDTWIQEIVPIDKNTVFLSTPAGLVKYDPVTKAILYYRDQPGEVFKTIVYAMVRKEHQLFLATGKGLFQFDPATEQIRKIDIPVIEGKAVLAVEVDGKGNFWVVIAGKPGLLKLSADFERYEIYEGYLEVANNTLDNFTSMIADKKGRIWITTQLNGLLLYNDFTNKFERFLHDPLKIWTPSTNLHSSIFCDRDGTIWVGGNNGVNYFNPDKNLFHIIPVFEKDLDIRNRRVARVVDEDKNGKLWFGTLDGLVKFDPVTNQYREWNNREGKEPVLHFNSVRGVVCDNENNIWIATGKGINQYRQQENKMIFYTGKDSVSNGFYFSADKDRNGNIWFACRDGDGFYYYNPTDKKIRSIRYFPGLHVFSGNGGRKFFHDSKGRYWLGFDLKGLGMFDPATGKHFRWDASKTRGEGIAGNSIVDIKEDKKGVIWISSFTGLSSIDPETGAIRNYNHTNGLANSSVSALSVDDQNRLWIATGSGLMLLDSSRIYFTFFGLQHGLPSIEFPEHASTTLPNGDVMMPTQNGFIRFAPNEFKKENKQLVPFLTTLKVAGREDQLLSASKIELHADENFFTIGFAAINNENTVGTWYAYKLDGVDEDWKYTQNRFVDYTKLPGGNYTFRVKASVDREEWNGPEKTINIDIDTVFYKTWWFRLAIFLLVLILVYLFYRYRIRQQQKLLELQGKAQLLEKEKVMVMYESLKQQLNPHFLFNSLTSLSGLIQTDQKMAGNFLEQMSKIYRYILKNRDSELVSVKEELAFVQVYINLQKTRFKEGLQVKMNVSEDELHKRIAPVTLQNLVENAMKHNIIDLDTPLIIEITSVEGYLLVKNNLQKKNMVEASNKQGLASLQSLYQYLSRRPVFIEETANKFSVRIPLI